MAAKFVVIVEDADLAAFCIQDNYQETVTVEGKQEPNSESKEDYVERRVREYLGGSAAAGRKQLRQEARKSEDLADAATVAIVTEKQSQ